MGTVFVVVGVLLWSAAAAADGLPSGVCPGDGEAGLQAALAHADAGEGVAAELDLAACYRALGQETSESAALGRALDAGLPDADAALVRARLDDIGWPAPPRQDQGMAAMVEAQVAGATPTAEATTAGPDPLWAYTLTGIAGAALVAATATGFVALDADSEGGDALTPGIAAAACAVVGVAAGIAAVVLWPQDSEVRPTGGPGDVGVGILVAF